ncbi:MAG: hypothetical protein SFU86_00030 [Pirellulaceae bacterium]|nr:hypothetical protein [Pirellulaceae bacterium]
MAKKHSPRSAKPTKPVTSTDAGEAAADQPADIAPRMEVNGLVRTFNTSLEHGPSPQPE